MKIKTIITFIAMLALMLLMVSCGSSESVDESRYDGYEREDVIRDAIENIPNSTIDGSIGNVASRVIGDFHYPENPAEELRNALKNDVNERSLLMTISEVENVIFNNREYSQIIVSFSDSSNIAVISFLNRHVTHDIAVLLEGFANPSFTIAF